MTLNSIARALRYQHTRSRLKGILAIVFLMIALVLLVWSLANYQPAHNFYGPRAIYSLILLSIVLAVLGRALLLHFLQSETAHNQQRLTPQRLREAWRPLFLFDLNAPLYLAAAVLIGVPAAVLTALITQTFLQVYTLLRGYVSWVEASYRLAATALLTLLAGATFGWIGGSDHNYFTASPSFYQLAESREFLGAILAAGIMFLLLIVASLPITAQAQGINIRMAWRVYLHSPVLRFQILVLSVGPLLPVVDIFDNVVAELAWLFFLIPLFAIYYLALTTTRLSVRTGELQRTLLDLSTARRRQDELRDYASLITRVQEEERRRLSRELHDDTAQALIALSLGLDGLERAMGKLHLPAKDVQWLSDLQQLADATLEGVRRACRDLRPSVLDDLGLRAALEWIADSSAERGVSCTFTCTGTVYTTTPEAEIAIFRIVQEAVANVWRHSCAEQATITLQYSPEMLQVTISDNGRGFVSDQQPLNLHDSTQHGLGLLGMRERATLIGAHLTITSAPGHGCSITVSLPTSSEIRREALA